MANTAYHPVTGTSRHDLTGLIPGQSIGVDESFTTIQSTGIYENNGSLTAQTITVESIQFKGKSIEHFFSINGGNIFTGTSYFPSVNSDSIKLNNTDIHELFLDVSTEIIKNNTNINYIPFISQISSVTLSNSFISQNKDCILIDENKIISNINKNYGIDLSSGKIINSSNTLIDLATSILNDISGNKSIDSDNRILYNKNGQPVISYSDSIQFFQSGSPVTFLVAGINSQNNSEYHLQVSDFSGILVAMTNAEERHVYLPDPKTVIPGSKTEILEAAGTGNLNHITIHPFDKETIDGKNICYIKISYGSNIIQTDGNNWFISSKPSDEKYIKILDSTTTGLTSFYIVYDGANLSINNRTSDKKIISTHFRNVIKNTVYDVQPSDFGSLLVPINSNTRNLYMPNISTVPIGIPLYIKDESGTAGTSNIILHPNENETFDGQSSIKIETNFGGLSIYSNGSNYFKYTGF